MWYVYGAYHMFSLPNMVTDQYKRPTKRCCGCLLPLGLVAAFTGLFLQVHGRVSDIWRSYIVQRLLWDAGYAVAFAPPMVIQKRGPHNYLADMQVRS
jgi:hypothetical protein